MKLGELIEEEIEVEEEIVIDMDGNELKKRQRPILTVVNDPDLVKFIKKHGGVDINQP